MFRVRIVATAALAIAATAVSVAPAASAAPPTRPVVAAVAPGGASADVPRAAVTVDPGTLIAIIKAAYSAYQSFTSGGLTLAAATQQILNAIVSARDAIITHIDAVAVAQVRGCAQSAVLDFPNFGALTPDNKQAFARDATSCITLADSLITTVSDLGAVDQLGFALNSLGPIALITRSATGLSNSGLAPLLKQDNSTLLTKLLPTCRNVTDGEGRKWVVCRAYNGDSSDQLPPNMVRQARDLAGARTSYPLAEAVLPTFP